MSDVPPGDAVLPEHGTESRYARHGCRCPICKHHRYRRTKGWTARRCFDPLIDADPVKERLAMWAAEGFSSQPIITLAYGGDWARVRDSLHTRYARRILSLDRPTLLAVLPDTTKVPVVGARRRIRALQATGWPLAHILSGDVCTIRNVVNTTRPRITAGVHRLVNERYDRLAMTPGPSRSARLRAAAFPPPLAWDDDTIDDPAATPALGFRRTEGTDRMDEVAERREHILQLTAAGHSAAHIADALGVTDRTVVRARKWAS